MKITKHADEVSKKRRYKEEANKGCYTCPCCGTPYERLFGTCKNWAESKGLFKTRNMRIDCYTCDECGAEWESEPYET